KPVAMSDRMIAAISEVCDKNGIAYEVMPSGAGHDAMNVAEVLPTGMIFLPCKGGISHNPAEEIEMSDFEAAFDVLSELLIEEANRD
ncbi:MAG: M20/M25/M40 family metallo-hydrolase, partial [Oscillospiraceae bacterium]|nr:M20/M25/M40 family metallo-hydrolase [Oscillospiraceae bacterium]